MISWSAEEAMLGRFLALAIPSIKIEQLAPPGGLDFIVGPLPVLCF